MINPTAAWLFAAALAFAPPDRTPQFPSHPETVEQRTERYQAIASDIFAVAFDPKAEALPGLTRRQSAALMLAVAIGESHLAPDADLGPCYRKGKLWRTRCDSGWAVGIMQTRVHPAHQEAYFNDRRKALRLGHQRLRQSLSMCRHLAPLTRLAAYGSGSCNRGKKGAAKRWRLYQTLLGFRLPKAVPNG
jgi:hypothetical protein